MPANRGRLAGVTGGLLVRRFSVRQPEMFRVVEAVAARKLASMDKAALCELAQTVMDLEFDGIDGDFLQAGCGLGGATIVIAHAKRRARSFTAHDPFSTPDAERRVREELAAHNADERLNVQIMSGPYEEMLWQDGPLALAYADCGEYDTMRVLLEKLTGRLVSGGQLVVDDYKTSEECKRAVDEYFRGKSGFRFERKSRLYVIRN